ncbi:hypothetical protein K8640_41465 [Myxococcus sp. XM-1-1-1]|uniref:hypothetical protein n=1 Tax=Myxococcus sp. XM-1-1-1 TaxID=2874602 RepID=UPI001CBF36AA|nr:hypothetical protein [Myxococcus sp. XM-1-1-1]MBZ4414704.1 hypothetical protein [Myxococcus sp. XM-1-1-1]
MDPNLGEKIYQASCFISDIYKQVRTLLVACDTLFADAGIAPINGNEVELHRARNLDAPAAWNQQAVGRLYAPKKRPDGTVSAFIVVEVHLRPKSATHALLVLAYAEPSLPVIPQALSSEYKEGEWLEDLLVNHYPAQAEWNGLRAAHPRHLSLADGLHLKAWPLTEFTDEESLGRALRSQLALWAPDLFK